MMLSTKKPYTAGRPVLDGLIAFLILATIMMTTGCLPNAPEATEPTGTLLPTPQTQPSEVPATAGSYPPPVAAYPPLATPDPIDSATAYPPPESPATTRPAVAVAATTPPVSDEPLPDVIFFPIIGLASLPVASATPIPPPTGAAVIAEQATPPVTLTPPAIEPVDFDAARIELNNQGRDLAFNKIGFHVTFLEDRAELDHYMTQLNRHGVPFFLKSVDNAEPLYKAQELMKAGGVDHTLVYRSTAFDVPNYDLPPEQAAEIEWEAEKAIWPPELDPGLIWLETVNEPDKNRAEWLARFSLRKAQLALRDGYRWAAFSWAAGEPEPADWESPAMLELLRLIGENPDRLAIALHEYSYLAEDIGHEYPYKVGRFLDLFRIADKHGIPRPTVLITEWGWTYNNIPPLPEAMVDIDWAARLYGAYPQVKGAAIWNLGLIDGQLLDLNDQVQALIDPLTGYSLTTYFSVPRPPEQTPLDPGQFPPP